MLPSLRRALPLLALLFLCIVVLAPALSTGYCCDDAGNSLIAGMLKYYGRSFWQQVWVRTQEEALLNGRFRPLVWLEVFGTFHLIPSLLAYKGIVVALVALGVWSFHLLLRQLEVPRSFSLLAALTAIGLFQFRLYHDPILGYNGMLPLLFLKLVVSLIAFLRYLDSGRFRWLALSIVSYALCILAYEISYLFCAFHLVIAFARNRRIRHALASSWPVVATAVVHCVATSVLYQGRGSNSYAVSSDPSAFLVALGIQLWAALPLSYWWCDPASLFGGGFTSYWSPGSTLLFSAAFAMAWYYSHGLKKDGHYPVLLWASLGVLLWFLPAVLIAVLPGYQSILYWGVGYVPVYLQHYGVALLLMSAWAALCIRLPRVATVARPAVALLVAGTVAMTFSTNEAVARKYAQVKAVRMCYEQAFQTGLLEPVHDGATMLLTSYYPWWHGGGVRSHTKYFYCQQAGKRVTTVDLTDIRWDPGSGAGRRSSDTPASGLDYQQLARDDLFAIGDRCQESPLACVWAGPLDGVCVDSLESEPCVGIRRGRIYVQGDLLRDLAGAPLAVLGEEILDLRVQAGSTLPASRRTQRCPAKTILRGDDWALLEFAFSEQAVDFASIRVTDGSAACNTTTVAAERSETRGKQEIVGDWSEKAGRFCSVAGGLRAYSAEPSLAVRPGEARTDTTVRVSVALPPKIDCFAGPVARYHGPGDDNMYVAALVRKDSSRQLQIWRGFQHRWILLASRSAYDNAGTLIFQVQGPKLHLTFENLTYEIEETRLCFRINRTNLTATDHAIASCGLVGVRASRGSFLDWHHSDEAALAAQSPSGGPRPLPGSESLAVTQTH